MTGHVRRRTVLGGIASGIALTFAGQVSAGDDARYVVTTGGPAVADRVEREGFDVVRTLADGHVLLAEGPSSQRDDLEGVTGVKEVARDVKVEIEGPEKRESTEASTDEDLFPLQWDKQDSTTDAALAHDQATGEGTKLAIIDSGTEFGHPDLEANSDASEGRLFRFGDVRAGTGPVEVPVDWTDLSKGTETVERHVANDVLGHGTHVSGIAAASNDGTTGVVGTAPDAEIVPLRVFWWVETGDGDAALYATFGDILTSIEYAADVDADALNMSLGTPPLPPQINAGGIRGALERVIDRATASGTVVVNAAGNDDANLDGGEMMFPASVAGAMAISATGPNDERAFYSNYGTSDISVGAPGGGYETLEKTLATSGVEWPFPTNLVLNTLDSDTLFGQYLGGAEYAYLAGTSMAAPQVAGAVGLVREVAPNASAEKVQKAIEETADGVQGEFSDDLGAGRLNADDAIDADVLPGR